jgi:alkylation response protein AidB-like acyl-CoA dehydrogenase
MEEIVTIVDRNSAAPQHVLDRARELAPKISGRAAEIESARRVPRDLLDELIGAGCFRVLMPRSHGGIGADVPSGMRVFEALAEADASVAWTVVIGANAWLDVAGLPRASFDALFAATPDVIIAGAINPSGSIAAVDGGYRVSGRWGFASGCEHATWLCGNCVEGMVDGVPQLRMAVFSPDEVVIEDTWKASGLCGTGSHHFHVADVVVPAERTLRPLVDEPCLDEPIVRIPPPPLYALAIASVAIGIAQGALDDIVALATSKVPLLAGAPLAANPLFQFELATADTELRAARALLYDTAESVWATAADGQPFTLEQRARARAAAVWATTRAAAVVDTAYRSGGGSSVYVDSPLQRRLRDIHAVTQHFLVKRDTLTTAGAILAGQDVTVMLF